MKNRKNILVILVILLLITGSGFLVTRTWLHKQRAAETDKNLQELYKTNPEGAQCVEDWYKKYPDSRPENHKPGYIYLPPPCSGVPQ